MEYRTLGRTGLSLPALAFGASSLGAEFRSIDIAEAVQSVRVALDHGMNFIDTSPFYGRGMSEVLLGIALQGVPRDSYILGTKLGRYDVGHFDFSAKRVVESIDVSLHRLRVDSLDICLCHDIEFVDIQQIIEETLPALQRIQERGKVRCIGVSGYPMKIFRDVMNAFPIDVMLSYNHYTLQNTMLVSLLDDLESKGIGIMNAAPFSARLLTNAPLPVWHKADPNVREVCSRAAAHARAAGSDIAKVALQFSLRQPQISTTIVGSANPENVARWARWAAEPFDEKLCREILDILAPIHDWFYIEGKSENNDRRPWKE